MKQEMGKRIQKIREELGMSRNALAKEIGITGQYLGQLEKGKGCLSLEKLKRLCEFTHFSADYILFGEDPNLIVDTKLVLNKFTDKQIKRGCNMLKELALFISDDDE